jgi:tetratricopeptide (TPR) repeat protein
MSYKEITLLRKSGKLDEAYQLALPDLRDNPNDIWIKRAASWVFYGYLKMAAESIDENMFLENVQQIANLNLPTDESVLFDSIAWQCGKILMHLEKDISCFCDSVFKVIKNFSFTRPSDSYSFLFHAFHRHRNIWNGYLDFCDWWNFNNFQSVDYKKYKSGNQEIMSLVEQAYIGYAKVLLSVNDVRRKELFLLKLTELIKSHPEYQYPLYFEAKLLLSLGKKNDAFELLLPFVRKKQNDYWVWQILGDASDNKETAFSCYSKALTCHCKDEMLVSIKECYAKMLLERGLYGEAKMEIEQVVAVRNKHDWKISDFICHSVNEPWYKTSVVSRNNNVYRDNAAIAENIIYSDMKLVSIIITSVNIDKGIANFMTLSLEYGFFYYSRFFKKALTLGDKFDVRFIDFEKNKPSHIATIEKCVDDKVWSKLMRDVCGLIKIDVERRFGIVCRNGESFFVSRALLKYLSDGDNIKGKVVKSYDKKRNCWGWSFINILNK